MYANYITAQINFCAMHYQAGESDATRIKSGQPTMHNFTSRLNCL
jgi:hypothetical protein